MLTEDILTGLRVAAGNYIRGAAADSGWYDIARVAIQINSQHAEMFAAQASILDTMSLLIVGDLDVHDNHVVFPYDNLFDYKASELFNGCTKTWMDEIDANGKQVMD